MSRNKPSKSASKLAAKIRTAIGASPNDKIRISGPQFTRMPGMAIPACVPASKKAWNDLRSMDRNALKEMGLQADDEPDENGKVLMLLPGEWYAYIPVGYEMETINGEIVKHSRSGSSDDIRFGCLAYGIRVKAR